MQATAKTANDAPELSKPAVPNKPRTRRMQWVRNHPWLSLLLLAIVAGAAWYIWGRDTVAETRPLIATIEKGDIENAVTAAGTLQPSRFVDVGAQVSGQLDSLQVDVGEQVNSGDLVAEIDATVQINRVEASRASLRALEAQLSARQSALELAQANAERQKRLMQDDASTQTEFDSAMNSLASAQSSLVQLQSQIEQSKASLASDEAQLGYTKIYAPTDGTVVSVSMKEGQTLNANQQTPIILRIADLSTMTVEAQVSEADVTKLKTGMEVYFTTLGSGDRRWYGTLRQILPTPVVTNNVVLYTALFDVDNSDQVLLSSMTAQVFFVTASARDVLKVPVGALSYTAGAGKAAGAAQTFADSERARSGTGMGAGTGTGGGMGAGGTTLSDAERAARTAEMQARQAAGGMGAAAAGMGAARADGRGTVAYVQFVLPDGSTERREIRVGVTSRISAEVLTGLNEGDKVVAGVLQARTAEQQRPSSGFNFR